ncbi:extracellular solute-binding protein [Paenibacillus sp. P26]|nr:extracellular solute-binding protein [Paenibacillus sp. P26]
MWGAKQDSSGNQAPAAQKTKITMWSQFADPNSKDGGAIAFYKALDATKAKFPDVEIDHVGTGGEAYKAKLPATSAADELPDIFFAWGGGSSQPFVAGKRVLAIDDLVMDGTLARLVPGTTDNFKYDGKLYGLPTTIATANLYINKELLDQAGAKIPTTWDEFVAVISALKAKGVTPIALGAKDRWPAMFWNAILDIRMGGVDAMNAALKKNGSFDSPEFVEAARKYKELIDMKAFGDNYLGNSYDDSVNAFLSGKAAMLFMGGWVNGQINADNSAVKGKVVTATFPTIPGGKGNADEWFGGAGETFLINAKIKNKDKVWQVYKFFMEDLAKESFLAGSGSSAWKGDIGDTSKVDPLVVQIAQLSAKSAGFSYWWDQMLNGNDTESMFGSLMKFVGGKQTPEQYTKELQSKINPGK